MKVTRTFDILDNLAANYPKEDTLAGKENKKWVKYSTNNYVKNANNVSYGLLALGLKPGDKVATVSNNRPEWNFIDMGLSQAGMVHVPVYPTISYEEYEHILAHSDAKIIIVSDKILYKKIKPIIDKTKSIQGIYTFNKIEGANHWSAITELGQKSESFYAKELVDIRKQVKEDDLVTIIYTSGTTGLSKGVMLSHKNLVSNAVATSKAHYFGSEHRTLSFLPLCHVYERMLNYHFQYKGISFYYAENVGTIGENLKEVKPQIFSTVPRLLESVFAKIQNAANDLSPLKKEIFDWALKLGFRYDHDHKNGFLYTLQLKLANKLVFSKWREALGNNVKIIVSGGAALQPRLARVFGAAGIYVLEGYGLTETAPVIAVSNFVTRQMEIGTVGPVLSGVSLKIADDGEIMAKGPNIMLGYYKNPELTKQVITEEGYFHTGDIGELTAKGNLRITDRKKEIFKMSSGKYISPQVIENKFKESPIIEQLMVVGENEKFASAIISPSFEQLHNYSKKNKIEYASNKDLIDNKEIISLFQKEVRQINKNVGKTEEIKRFKLVCEEWTPVSGELSPTLKLKRKVLYQKYDHLLEEIYNPSKI